MTRGFLMTMAMMFLAALSGQIAVGADRTQSLEDYLTTLDFGAGHRPSAASCQDQGGDKYLCILTINGNDLEYAVTVRNGRTVDAVLSPRQQALCRQARPDAEAVRAAVAAETSRTSRAVGAYLRAHKSRPDTAQLRALVRQNGLALGRLASRLQLLSLTSPWGRETRAVIARASLAQAQTSRAYAAGHMNFRDWLADLQHQNAAIDQVLHSAPCLVLD